ncbi:hypothetical protein CH063_03545 [Colletotrichum higginsianum]|uniref:Uncharacterized protein n=2 Tax=Colletotrichum higginsianum TaxID=80884 RepID=H1VYB2_COLHI|nr:hypothetical protein CH63R_04502 [Colletotrichum higginsianum IMI 349063]OBR12206.1 hypothetical protein CH63R_04502 [Colletotrichum higginsianum IMI 349063]TIC99451.1 hypothetical protein CH35J_005653 [Colletotrichum higginsianum]GJC93883.1 hypothetical protein ColKHC_02709 [Colletotrichum higginsianum]CCF45224.1 hypothetical protein CH063_03545 [Colletotrichum higginsianum]
MAAAIESQVQFERDLRSAHQDYKRTKDSQSKWSNGARPLAGCRLDWTTLEAVGGTEQQRAKTRPRGKNSETSHHKKTQHNVTKFRSHWELPHGRVQSAARAKEQIKDPLSRSVMEMAPSQEGWKNLPASEDWKYSFDRIESPNRPLTLDVFIKTTGRETERMVEKEYEILNENGQILKGRKARQSLRQDGLRIAEDDGFQLV